MPTRLVLRGRHRAACLGLAGNGAGAAGVSLGDRVPRGVSGRTRRTDRSNAAMSEGSTRSLATRRSWWVKRYRSNYGRKLPALAINFSRIVARQRRSCRPLLPPGVRPHSIRRAFGLIATNTIGQGDTRSTGLRWICNHGGTIYAARKRLKWPGEAAVVVSVIHVHKGTDTCRAVRT